MKEQVTPYGSDATKKEQVAEMFDNIAHRYDFLNHVLSLGIDVLWRRKAIRLLRDRKPQSVLDVATGTGDFAMEAIRMDPKEVIGVDISNQMLEVGRTKLRKRKLDDRITLEYGDSENLPYDNDRFDALTVAFGVRNFGDLEQGLREMLRVVKPGSQTAIIEFSQPQRFPVKQLYRFYFKYVLPGIGKTISKDSRAYTYLPDSVDAFPYGTAFAEVLKRVGYSDVRIYPLTFGIASIYLATK